jgi:hypothetical protein
MNRIDRKRSRKADEQEDQQAVVGTASFGDRHDGEPWYGELHRHAVADESADHGRQAVNDQARQYARQQAKCGERKHRGEREPIDLARFRGGRRARPAEKGDAECLDEAGCRKGRRQREQGADPRYENLETPLGQVGPVKDGLKGQPL